MEKIGKYQVVKKLGEGATSVVYLAHDPFAARDVAIKVVAIVIPIFPFTCFCSESIFPDRLQFTIFIPFSIIPMVVYILNVGFSFFMFYNI